MSRLKISLVERIEKEVAHYTRLESEGNTDSKFPIPLSGSLLPVPSDKREAGALLRKTRWNALHVTGGELAKYLGVSPRTFEKWEQGRYFVNSATWKLFQLAIRFPEVRSILKNQKIIPDP